MLLRPDSPQINWLGAVSLQKEDSFIRPWRLVYNDLDLFYVPELQNIHLSTASKLWRKISSTKSKNST